LSFHCLKIPLFSMPSSHDPVIKMFHCLFIPLSFAPCHQVTMQWSVFSAIFSLFWKSHCSPCHPDHDPVIRMFHCLFNLLKIPLFSCHLVIHCFDIFWQRTIIKFHFRILLLFDTFFQYLFINFNGKW
jgi:hypothetical protein